MPLERFVQSINAHRAMVSSCRVQANGANKCRQGNQMARNIARYDTVTVSPTPVASGCRCKPTTASQPRRAGVARRPFPRSQVLEEAFFSSEPSVLDDSALGQVS
jgi:hypothetical protein